MNEPTPFARDVCDICGETLIAKCGEINIWHWSHTGGTDCDLWHEHETVWHRRLKQLCKSTWPHAEIEKTMREKNYGQPFELHRADVFLPAKNLVIELQHSPISSHEIRERELFYRDLVWIVDLNDSMNAFHYETNARENYHTFCWKYAKRSFSFAKMPVILHCNTKENDFFLLVKKHYQNFKYGWGHLYPDARLAIDAALKVSHGASAQNRA